MKQKLIDMHIHTTSSDGDYTPKELIQRIKTQGQIKTFSFTNHDNIDDNITMQKIDLPDQTYINGCEFTATPILVFKRKGYQCHILAYDFNLDNHALKQLLATRKKYDEYNFMLVVEALKKQGITLPQDQIAQIKQKPKYNRADLARLLIQTHQVSTPDEAFDKYLNPAKNEVEMLQAHIHDEEIIETIKQAGGYASLAHPIKTKLDKQTLSEYLEYLKSIGLDAIEVYHPDQPQEYRDFLLDQANKHNLLISGGTDYHGPDLKPDIELGTGRDGNIKIRSLSLVDRILTK